MKTVLIAATGLMSIGAAVMFARLTDHPVEAPPDLGSARPAVERLVPAQTRSAVSSPSPFSDPFPQVHSKPITQTREKIAAQDAAIVAGPPAPDLLAAFPRLSSDSVNSLALLPVDQGLTATQYQPDQSQQYEFRNLPMIGVYR